MLNYSGNNKHCEAVAKHYCTIFNDSGVSAIISNQAEVGSSEQAKSLAEFYWFVLDETAKEKPKINQLSDSEISYAVERLFHLIGGFLDRTGYGEIWEQVCDDA